MNKNNEPAEISVKLAYSDLVKVSKDIGLTDSQSNALWQAFQETQRSKSRRSFSTTLLYLGAWVIFLSMTWFYTSRLNNGNCLFLSIAYALIFFSVGAYFWYVKKFRVFGGVVSSLGIIMIPLVVYSLQNLLNWWMLPNPAGYRDFYYWIHGRWLPMEVCTLLVACTALYFIRFPFITVLIYSVILFMAMDAVQSVSKDFMAHLSIVSMVIGLVLTFFGFFLNRCQRNEFSFWAYLFGTLLFWSGLAAWNKQTEWEYFIYFSINCVLLFLSDFFHRKIFMTFGLLGIIYYVGHLAYVFSDSLMFSYVLAGIGFCAILLSRFLLRSQRKV